MKLFDFFTIKKHSKSQKRGRISKNRRDTYYFMPETKQKSKKIKRSKKSQHKKRFISMHIPPVYYKIWLWTTIVCIITFFWFWPILKIENIYISWDNTLININKAYESMNYLRGKNLLFTQSSDVIDRLKNNQESIQSIQVEASFPNSIFIDIWSYDISFQTDTHFILNNGVLVEKKWSQSDVPEIIIAESNNISQTEESLSQADILAIKNTLNLLRKNISWFQTDKIYYAKKEHELIINHTNKNIFIFDLFGNIEAQVEKLSIYNTDTKNISTTPYTYIDVRIPWKLFLCWWESENICKRNLSTLYGAWLFTSLNSGTFPPSQ